MLTLKVKQHDNCETVPFDQPERPRSFAGSGESLRHHVGKPAFVLFAADGCIGHLKAAFAYDMQGMLSKDEQKRIDWHLLGCRRCENHWEALLCELEDSFPFDAVGLSVDDNEASMQEHWQLIHHDP